MVINEPDLSTAFGFRDRRSDGVVAGGKSRYTRTEWIGRRINAIGNFWRMVVQRPLQGAKFRIADEDAAGAAANFSSPEEPSRRRSPSVIILRIEGPQRD